MTDGFQIDSNAMELVQRFSRMPANQQRGIVNGLTRGLLVTETKIRTNTEVKFRRGGAGLGGRLTSFVRVRGNQIDAAVGFRKTRLFPYELSQEFGAKGPMTIPISPEAKAQSNRGLGARTFGDRLVLIKGPRRVVLVEHLKTRSVLHYVIVNGIRPRLKFRQNVAASIPMISQEVVKGWKEGIAHA